MQALRRWAWGPEAPTSFERYTDLPDELKHEVVAALAGADRLALACCSSESCAAVLGGSAFERRAVRRAAAWVADVAPTSAAWRDAYGAQRAALRQRLQRGEAPADAGVPLLRHPAMGHAAQQERHSDGEWVLFCSLHALCTASFDAPDRMRRLLTSDAAITAMDGTRHRWAVALCSGVVLAGGAHGYAAVVLHGDFESLAWANDGALAAVERGRHALQVWHPRRGTARHCIDDDETLLAVHPLAAGGLALRRSRGVDLLDAAGELREIARTSAGQEIAIAGLAHGEVALLLRPASTLALWGRPPAARLQVHGSDGALLCSRTMPWHTRSILTLADDGVVAADRDGLCVLRRVAGRLRTHFRVDIPPSRAGDRSLRLAGEFAPGMLALTDPRPDSLFDDETGLLFVDLETRSILAAAHCRALVEVEAALPDGTLFFREAYSQRIFRLASP